MRINTAFVLALSLVLVDVRMSSAETQDPQPQNRNPIVWFLSDLGKLLETSVSAITQKPGKNDPAQLTATKPENAPVKQTTEASVADLPVEHPASQSNEPAEALEKKPSILSIFQDLANLFSPPKTDHETSTKSTESVAEKSQAVQVPSPLEANTETKIKTPAASSDAPREFRNPITWLLSDLSRLLQPTLEIDNQPTPDVTAEITTKSSPVEAKPAEIIAPVVETVAASVQNAASEKTEETTNTKAEKAEPHAKLLNPVEWLIRDLANLLTPTNPLASVDETVVQSTRDEATDGARAIVEPDISNLPSALSVHDTPSPETASGSGLIAEVGPWVPRPNNNLFDPNDSLFGVTGSPLTAHTPAQDSAAPTEIAEAQTKPVVRERPDAHPEIRNYRSLGYDPKAIHKKSDDDQGFIGNVLEQLLGTDPQNSVQNDTGEPLSNKIADTIVPEEKLDLGYISPDAKSQGLELTRIGEGPLTDIDLYLGNKITLGAAYSASEYKHDSCIERSLHGSVFCLKSLDWPQEISKSFSTDTAYVLPGEGVVRYENGTSSRIYAVFNSADFAQVVKYMQHRFGPPQEREIGWMHMLEAPRMPNTTFRWQAFSPDRREIINLEVRNYDDLRRSFADMDHGMVRLYRSGSRPIFKHISTMDLMLMQRRRVASAPVEVNQPPKQQ